MKTVFLDKLTVMVFRWLRVPCGGFGGSPGNVVQNNRWCLKKFGHEDSCAFDEAPQPLWKLRRRCRGWK
jgi:hypothetical protein